MSADLELLLATAATIGVVHTLIGPDHYLPFIAMARARGWSLGRTLALTSACGVGHVLGSVLLGGAGIALGWAVGSLEWVEAVRGDVAAWLLLGFGLAYMAWGIRRARRDGDSRHWHGHADGTVHVHGSGRAAPHGHRPGEPDGRTTAPGPRASLTPWVLFTIFVFGPCEPLIPVLMYPAATGSWSGVAAVAGVFGGATILTMTALVAAGSLGLSRLPLGAAERWSHALAGAALAACGAAIHLGL